MTKIIGSVRDFEKKQDAALTSATPTPKTARPETGNETQKPGPTDEPELNETGLELPPDTDTGLDTIDETMKEDLELYRAACREIQRFMSDASALNLDAVTQHARLLVKRLQTHDGLRRLAMRNEYIEPFLGAHPVNIAVFSAVLADALKLDQTRKLRLMVAALVHDIGMTRLDPDVLKNQRDLTQEEENALWQHPNFGADIILERFGPEYEWLARIVRQEHERVQGQGYPNGLTEEQIDLNALTIGLLDVFEAITHPRRQHAVFNPSKAINQIIATRNQLFSTRVVKALVEAISVYPVETYVQLNTGQIGLVVATHPKNPLRPVIEVYTDHARQPLPKPARIDLCENPVVSIVKALEYAEVPAGLR